MRDVKKLLISTSFTTTALISGVLSVPALAQTDYEYTSQPNLVQIGIRPALHDGETSAGRLLTGEGVGIAIFDGLAAGNNPDLVGKIVIPDPALYTGSYNFFDGHGTHVAGIAGAAKNGSGVVGVAPGATLYSIPVFDDSGWVAYDRGAAAFNYLVNENARGANIQAVNMSYGPSSAGDVFLSGELNLFAQYKDDFVLVRAAGNSGANAKYEYYNGVASVDLSHLLVVGSVDGANQLSYFSNKPGNACIGLTSTCGDAEKIKQFWIVAPGNGILSTLPSGWGKKSGTSMSAPHITGAVALVWQQAYDSNVALSPTDIASILKRSATDLGATGVDEVYGWGLLNVEAALQPIGNISVPIGETVDDTAPIDESTGSSTTTTGPKKGKGGGKGRFKSRTLLSGMIVLDEFKRPFEVEEWNGESERHVPSGDHLERLSSAVFSERVALTDTEQFSIAAWRATDSAMVPASSLHFTSEELTFDIAVGTPSAYFSQSQTVATEVAKPERFDGLMFAAMGDVGRTFDRAVSFQATTALSRNWDLSSFFLQSLERKAYLPGIDAPVPYYQSEHSAQFAGISFDRQIGTYGSLGLTYTTLYEGGAILGAYDDSLFGFGENGLTQTLGVRMSAQVSNSLSVTGFYSHAFVRGLGSGPSLFDRANWTGNQFGFSVNAKDVGIENDRLRLSVIKPLAVTDGNITAHVPIGREFDGSVIYDHRSLAIQDKGLPLSLKLDYLAPLGPLDTALSLDIADANAASEGAFRIGIMAGLSYKF